MAARFRFDGTTEYGVKTEADQFVRKLASDGPLGGADELSHVDVIAGGDGLSSHLAGAIDPVTGQRDYGENGRVSSHFLRWTDHSYHEVPWNSMIDGVFIPSFAGGRFQIDSLGDLVDLPANTGSTHGSLWTRCKDSVWDSSNGPDNDFWGTRTLQGIVDRLRTTRIGLIGMHANVGITFDLKMMQMVHRRAPVEFRAGIQNIENSADWAPNERPDPEVETRIADCRIFVDGALRGSLLGFRREDGEIPLVVPLSEKDRFLTILISDGDGEMRFDHVVKHHSPKMPSSCYRRQINCMKVTCRRLFTNMTLNLSTCSMSAGRPCDVCC